MFLNEGLCSMFWDRWMCWYVRIHRWGGKGGGGVNIRSTTHLAGHLSSEGTATMPRVACAEVPDHRAPTYQKIGDICLVAVMQAHLSLVGSF
jgi:hypothetical protein